MILSRILDGFANTLFPQNCGLCGERVESLSFGTACWKCWESTPLFTGDEALCPRCGRLLSHRGGPAAGRCHRCEDHAYDLAVACGIYEAALALSVLKLKSDPHIPAILCDVLFERVIRSGLDTAGAMVPVPLSARRRKERGFNQAEVIAESLRQQFGIPIDTDVLRRRVDTPMHRAAMDERARTATVKSAFEAVDSQMTRDRHVLLVDDVMTSGATASFCSKELKKAGAGRVSVITLARA